MASGHAKAASVPLAEETDLQQKQTCVAAMKRLQSDRPSEAYKELVLAAGSALDELFRNTPQ